MLAEDELAELAADITQRGLLQPIVLDPDGRVLDGRNRLAACERAGVKPDFVTYEGDDADGYALAVNVRRRNLTKGQQAMVIALADDLFNLNSQARLSRDSGIPQARFSQAKTIVKFARDFAEPVVAGAVPFDTAYKTAQERQRAKDEVAADLAEAQQSRHRRRRR
jgi:ParB-like chromosome segregation protein Spo0J